MSQTSTLLEAPKGADLPAHLALVPSNSPPAATKRFSTGGPDTLPPQPSPGLAPAPRSRRSSTSKLSTKRFSTGGSPTRSPQPSPGLAPSPRSRRSSAFKLPIKISTDPSFAHARSGTRSSTRSSTSSSSEDIPAARAGQVSRRPSSPLPEPPAVKEGNPASDNTPPPTARKQGAFTPEKTAARRPPPLFPAPKQEAPEARPGSPERPRQQQQPASRPVSPEAPRATPQPPTSQPTSQPPPQPPPQMPTGEQSASASAQDRPRPVVDADISAPTKNANPTGIDTTQAYQGQNQAAKKQGGPMANPPLPDLSRNTKSAIGNLPKRPVGPDGQRKGAGLTVSIKLDLVAEVHLTARVRGDILVGLF